TVDDLEFVVVSAGRVPGTQPLGQLERLTYLCGSRTHHEELAGHPVQRQVGRPVPPRIVQLGPSLPVRGPPSALPPIHTPSPAAITWLEQRFHPSHPPMRPSGPAVSRRVAAAPAKAEACDRG